jgi:outer membrane biosynthesis protein TonB
VRVEPFAFHVQFLTHYLRVCWLRVVDPVSIALAFLVSLARIFACIYLWQRINKCRKRRPKMRFMEIANPEDQLALWRLISDNVWSAVMTQAKQAAAQKAQAAARPKPKKFKPKKAIPKPPPALKPKPPTPKPPPAKSPVPPQQRSVAPSRPSPLPSSQPVLRPTHSSSFSQADLHGMQQQAQGVGQSYSAQKPF